MSLHLQPDTEAQLATVAASHGLSVDEYVEALVRRELLIEAPESLLENESSGMVFEESGLRVYRTGRPMAKSLIENAIRRSRDDRALHVLGDLR
jgi:hypothetical protein